MHKNFIQLAAFLSGLAVILGAFGAHGLRNVLDERGLATFDTAVRYQFYHAFALMFTGILFSTFAGNYLRWAGRFFLLGIVIFSGSLYVLTLLRATGNTGFGWLGAITPIGGVCFVVGWLLMLIGVAKKS